MYSNKLYSSHALAPRRGGSKTEVGWSFEQVAGRLVEISGVGATASLTLAFGLVLQAQRQNEPVAWITLDGSLFYPPDAAEGGVDLDALTIVRVPDLPASAGQAGARAVARAADQLIRSGAFGLVARGTCQRARLGCHQREGPQRIHRRPDIARVPRCARTRLSSLLRTTARCRRGPRS